jgi:hypothetical protein
MVTSPPRDEVTPVGTSWWFGLLALVATAGSIVLAILAAVFALGHRGRTRWGAALIVVGCIAIAVELQRLPTPSLLRDLDFALGFAGRQAIVEDLESGLARAPDEMTRRVLASQAESGDADRVQAIEGRLMVFFTRVTGFSPDPYCGYEYASSPRALDVDPLDSGTGVAEPLGDDWYWICAS